LEVILKNFITLLAEGAETWQLTTFSLQISVPVLKLELFKLFWALCILNDVLKLPGDNRRGFELQRQPDTALAGEQDVKSVSLFSEAQHVPLSLSLRHFQHFSQIFQILVLNLTLLKERKLLKELLNLAMLQRRSLFLVNLQNFDDSVDELKPCFGACESVCYSKLQH
jgi:hypothetical protein